MDIYFNNNTVRPTLSDVSYDKELEGKDDYTNVALFYRRKYTVKNTVCTERNET